MGRKRFVSMESNVYHKKDCHYAKRIQDKHGQVLTVNQAQYYGYRPCRYCNSMRYAINFAAGAMNYYEEKKGMKFKVIDSALYALTDIGCWKLVYSETDEKMLIYHRNHSDVPVNFQEPDKENYHFQKDVRKYTNIEGSLNYIYEHDRYRRSQKNDEKNYVYTNKKYKKKAKNKARKESINRVNDLFRMLEAQNKDLIQYSIC